VPPGDAALSPYGRVARYSVLVNAVASVVAGVAMTCEFAFGLQRFGGLEYVPRVILLSALRSLGLWAALDWTSLIAVIVVDRASRSAPRPLRLDKRRAWLLGVTVVALYPFDVACQLLSAMAVLKWGYEISFVAFISSARAALFWSDALYGAIQAGACGTLAMLVLPSLLQWVAGSPRSLWVKLPLTWALSSGAFTGVQLLVVKMFPPA
jgi:ABC-type transporter Mla maintaining outer membrane lipid asymmetry permease subunit MlaE